MANAVHGRLAQIFVNEFDLSRYLNSFNANSNAPELDCTTFLAAAREYVADFADGTLDLEGFFSHDDADLDTANDVFEAALSTANEIVTVAPEGATTLGNRVLIMDATENRHTVEAPAAGLITSMAGFRGGIKHGVLLAEKASRTTTGNGTSHNNGAATSGGAVAHLHVFSTSGTAETLDVEIEHSPDNSTWETLATFAQKTDVGSERVEVAGTTAVAQVETQTITGPATASANVIVIVTGAGITGSPVSTNVAVLNGDTAAQVAGKIRTALQGVAAITALYTVGGAGADITLTRINPTANDPTLNIEIDGTTNSTGVPDDATSVDTTAGVAAGLVYQYTRAVRTIGGSSTPTFNYAVSFARL